MPPKLPLSIPLDKVKPVLKTEWRWSFIHKEYNYWPTIIINDPKNISIKRAYEKYRKGQLGRKGGRKTTQWLMEGIELWLKNEKIAVINSETEEMFVKYVWHCMREKQRFYKRFMSEELININKTMEALSSYYDMYPSERKSAYELLIMFERFKDWNIVRSSEINKIKTKQKRKNRLNVRRNAISDSPNIFKNKKNADMARRMQSIRGPFPPSPSSSPHKNMARELIELGKMFKDGLLTKDEFNKAKANLL